MWNSQVNILYCGQISEDEFWQGRQIGKFVFSVFLFKVSRMKESVKMFIVTNNSKIKESFPEKDVRLIDTSYIGVLEECRKYIHKGCKLLSHPLYGSVKPNETPYRTVIMAEGKGVDYQSVELIEDAINTASKFQNDKKTPNWIERVMDDFRVIDLDIMTNTISRIQYEY